MNARRRSSPLTPVARGFSPASVALVGSLLVISTSHAQQPAPPRAGTVDSGVTAVMVDVVVRDRRGEPVRDLKPSDFQILEDGIPQTLGSFTAVFEGNAAAVTPSGPAPPGAEVAIGSPPLVDAGPAVTALVFDRLSPESRRLAVEAAQSYVGTEQDAPNYIGIFGIDLGLSAYAPFTRNARVLREALGQIAGRASASFDAAEMRQQRASADRQAAMAADAAAGAQAAGGAAAGAAMGTAPGEALLAQMQSRMIQEFDVLARDQQGYATTNGLFAIVGALRRLPGRKSLVFFSEGVSIPPPVQRLFLGVIDAANRANVSIYTMDAAGLRAESEQAKIRDAVNQAARRGIDSAYASASGDAPLSKALEANEDALRGDPQTGLGDLAQSTGGLFFDSTNDLRQGLKRVEDDLRNFYLLGYTPSNETYDGRFRTIDVRVNRPGLTVAARKGYFAVRDTGGMPVNAWEAPALGALERKPVPNAFPVRAGALLFPEHDRPGLVPVVVAFSTGPLTFHAPPDSEVYTSDFAVLVRFLDRQNQTVRKVSQHYEINGPIGELERARQGEVIFYREPELPPGVYTMETIVYDAPSGKASARFSTVEVPKHDVSTLRVSSLVIVKRVERVAEQDRPEANPLLVRDVILHPNLGEPVSKAAKELTFYFAAYPAEGGRAAEATLELLQNGARVAQLPIALAPVDSTGRIQQVGRLPLDQLTSGTYEMRVVVKQGGVQVPRAAILRIVD
jgi:VWFA-related protein